MVKAEQLFEQKKWMSQDIKTGSQMAAVVVEGVVKTSVPILKEVAWTINRRQYERQNRAEINKLRRRLIKMSK